MSLVKHGKDQAACTLIDVANGLVPQKKRFCLLVVCLEGFCLWHLLGLGLIGKCHNSCLLAAPLAKGLMEGLMEKLPDFSLTETAVQEFKSYKEFDREFKRDSSMERKIERE